jgi:hypothetical protein
MYLCKVDNGIFGGFESDKKSESGGLSIKVADFSALQGNNISLSMETIFIGNKCIIRFV